MHAGRKDVFIFSIQNHREFAGNLSTVQKHQNRRDPVVHFYRKPESKNCKTAQG